MYKEKQTVSVKKYVPLGTDVWGNLLEDKKSPWMAAGRLITTTDILKIAECSIAFYRVLRRWERTNKLDHINDWTNNPPFELISCLGFKDNTYVDLSIRPAHPTVKFTDLNRFSYEVMSSLKGRKQVIK